MWSCGFSKAGDARRIWNEVPVGMNQMSNREFRRKIGTGSAGGAHEAGECASRVERRLSRGALPAHETAGAIGLPKGTWIARSMPVGSPALTVQHGASPPHAQQQQPGRIETAAMLEQPEAWLWQISPIKKHTDASREKGVFFLFTR